MSYAKIYNVNVDHESLYQFGFNIGKYIYVMDAYDDYFSDIRKNRFNPITRLYDYDRIKDDKVKIKDRLKFIISVIVSKIQKSASELLSNESNENEIIMNVINYGMVERFNSVSRKYLTIKRKDKKVDT